jgi:hypothetical protein
MDRVNVYDGGVKTTWQTCACVALGGTGTDAR